MKKLLIFILVAAFSSCFTPRTGYIDYKERRMIDWDPIYYVPGYFDPFFYRPFYRTPPTVIYRDRIVPVPSRPQQPRVENVRPYTPPPSPQQAPRQGTAPIRTFPKKEENKEK